MIFYIKNKKDLLAIIVKKKLQTKKGINFLTPNNFNIQFAFMNHKKFHLIKPHLHFKKKIGKINTAEVLYIIKGKLRIDFYNKEKNYLFSKIINTGDTIMLINQGHGFKTLKKTIMFEVKQGPYFKKTDKKKFAPINEKFIKIQN